MRGFFFHEATDRLMQSYLSPYFLIPVVIVVTVSLLDPFEITCTTGLSGVQSAFLSATFAVCLISAFAGGRFFSVFWGSAWFGSCLLLPIRRASGFWQVLLAQFLFSSSLLVMAWLAILAALAGHPAGNLMPVILVGLASVSWTSGAAALAGLLTTPAAASVFSGIITLYSLIPLVDPNGSIFTSAFRITTAAMPAHTGLGWPDTTAILILAGQGLAFALAAAGLYIAAMRRMTLPGER